MTKRFPLGVVPAVLLASLGLAACGGDAEERAEPSGVLSWDEVRGALLEDGSSVAGADVGPEDFAGFADERTADPASCQPLSTIIDLEPKPYRSARVQVDRRLGAWVHVQLLTYAGDEAREVFEMVDEAVDDCSAGYDEDRVIAARITGVERTDAPDLGDAVTSYRTTWTEAEADEPIELLEHMVLVRDGQQLLSFRAGDLSSDGEAEELLAAVVDAQWKRYEERP